MAHAAAQLRSSRWQPVRPSNDWPAIENAWGLGRMSSNQRVILITGASSGVGQSTARLLSQKGYKIFGTSRKPASVEAIPDVEMVPLDVRSDDSVAACLKAVGDEAGRIDVLVNNRLRVSGSNRRNLNRRSQGRD